MSEVSISVLCDPDICRNGEAILRLTGVALVPPGSTYRIDPIGNDGLTGPPKGWPSGDLKPRAQRITRDGVDLVIGSDVIDAAALAPGTPVTISVASVGARAQMLWPTLYDRPARSGVSKAVPPPPDASELAVKAAVALATTASAELLRQESAPRLPLPTGAEEAERVFVAAIARNLSEGGALSSLSLSADAPRRSRPRPASTGEEALASLRPAVERRADPPRDAARPGPPKPPKPAPAHTQASPPPVPLEAVPPPPMPPARRPRIPQVSVATNPTREAETRGRHWQTAVAFIAGVMLAGGTAFVLPNAMPRLAPRGAPVSVHTEIVRPNPTPPVEHLSSLAEILAVPDRSPEGEAAGGVTLEEALRRADKSLSGISNAGPNRREAKFWLRKALSAGLADERLLWAMTQLGTLYASPVGGAADFASARILWELASAKGDPVALCFLASLHEGGFGTPKNPEEALSLYRRAKTQGGCRGIDDAIARLTKAAP